MNLISFFIKRPVSSLIISIAIIFWGIISFFDLPLRALPVVDLPIITVTTNFPGASPKIMESYVSSPMEQALSSIEGVDYIESDNKQGSSVITINLVDGTDSDKALSNISAKVSSVRWQMPKEALDPVIEKKGSSSPVVWFGFSSKVRSIQEVTNYLNLVALPKFDSIQGVQGALAYGGQKYAMRIWLNPNKMAIFGVTPQEIVDQIKSQHLQASIGRLKGHLEELNLSANSSLKTPQEFGNIIIKNTPENILFLKDVADIELGQEDYNAIDFSNGEQAILVGVTLHNTANNIAVAAELIKAFNQLKSKLPAGIDANLIWDTTAISKASINNVRDTVIIAIFCVILITALFLGSVRALIIPVVIIPICLIGTCIFLKLLGYSINTITLLACVLSIGLIVDDAIIVLENIHRYMETEPDKIKAGIKGASEIFWSIITMTIIVAIVFIPIGFTTGVTGDLFKEFAFTISCTVILSGIFAIILTPMMTTKILKTNRKNLGDQNQHNINKNIVDIVFEKVALSYKKILVICMKIRIIWVVIFAIILFASYLMMKSTPNTLIPDAKQGVILTIAKTPTSTNINYATKYGKDMSKILQKVPESGSYGLNIGFGGDPHLIIGFVILDPNKKGRDESEIIKDLTKQFTNIPGVFSIVMNRPQLLHVTGFQQPVEFVLQTNESDEFLNSQMNKLIQLASNNKGLSHIQSTLKMTKPTANLEIDRIKAARLGISYDTITNNLRNLFARPTIGWFSKDGRSYKVIPEINPKFRKNPHQIKDIILKTSTGEQIPLGSILKINNKVGGDTLSEFQQLKSATFQASLTPGYTLGEALDFLEKATKEHLSPKIKYDYSGESRLLIQSGNQMGTIFILAIACIYLLLAWKFNSFIDPIIVLTTIPLAALGAFIAMKSFGISLNIFTKIGLLMLVGLISKQGILIVDFANHLKENKNLTTYTAVLEASRIRLRPILMTSCAMIIGSVPLIFTRGMGHESLNQMGYVIVGGLLIGSLLTLFILPIAYTYLSPEKNTKI